MSFREKSAWSMALLMLVTGATYLMLALRAPQAPVIGVVLPWVLLVILLSIVTQIVLALSSPKEAQRGADERERRVVERAGHHSGLVLATGIVCAAGLFIANADGSIFFHLTVGALILSHLVEYVLQIAYLRRSF